MNTTNKKAVFALENYVLANYNLIFSGMFFLSMHLKAWLPTTQAEEEKVVLTTVNELFGELKGIQFHTKVSCMYMYSLYIRLFIISTKIYKLPSDKSHIQNS